MHADGEQDDRRGGRHEATGPVPCTHGDIMADALSPG
jgi:hypothetical protein